MNKSVQLAIRASEIRSEINGLEPGDATLAKRRELLDSLNTVESEYRAALTTESEAEAGAPDANGLTAEEREFRTLETKAELAAGIPGRHERFTADRRRGRAAGASRFVRRFDCRGT